MAKSTCIAYVLWLIGGWFGLHHLYLGRDRHAFLVWSLGAGYFGLGLFRDLWRIPLYVKDANNDVQYIKQLVEQMKAKKRPPYSFVRQSAAVIAGNLWGYAVRLAIPNEEIFGFSFHWLEILVPLGIALGVHNVGNIGRQQGSLLWPLIGASSYLACKAFNVDGMSIASLASSSLFEAKAKEWRRKPYEKHSICKRLSILLLCCSLYLGLWTSFFYFNAEVTDSYGEPIKVRDAVHNFVTSPLWSHFTRSVQELVSKLISQGWQATWKQLMDDLDPLGERKALEVLGLDFGATQEQITSRWRQLSKEWHPDRYMDPEKKAQAHDKFVEIKTAYETLSNIKSRRSKKNKSFQDY